MKKARKLLAGILTLVMILCMIPTSVMAVSDQTHRDLAREAIGEGIVLLKNEDALPLNSSNTVALFGNGSIYTGSTTNGYQIGGGGAGWVEMDYDPIGPADALLEAAEAGEINVYKALTDAYKANINYVPDAAMYDAAAEAADTAVMFITRFSEEAKDISASTWNLTSAEKTMMTELSAHFENVVVVLNIPSVIGTGWSVDGNTDGIDIEALVLTYMGGEMGAYGLADVLLGKVNPSGKLVDTYAYDIYDYSTTTTFLENNSYVRYTEDIYVGYRYFETFAKDKVVYPFGFGLSYTSFDIKTESVTNDGENITVKATVTNTGDVAGKEVVQVYYSAPQAGEGAAVLSKSAIDLAAFAKTELLQPGKSQTLEVSFAIDDMASFDDNGLSGHESCYVLEAGDYDIIVGNSVRNNTVAGTYTVDELVVTEELSELCATTLDVRLTADGTYEKLNDVETDDSDANVIAISATEPTWFKATTSTHGNKTITENYGDSSGFLNIGTHEAPKWVSVPAGTVVGGFNNAVGGYVEYIFDVEEAGTYTLGIVASNGNSTKVDGAYPDAKEVAKITVSADGGNTWTEATNKIDVYHTREAGTGKQYWNFYYQTSDFDGDTYHVVLPEGRVKLRITNTGETDSVTYKRCSMNLDSLVIIPEGAEVTMQDVQTYYGLIKEEIPSTYDLDKDNYVGIKYEDVEAGNATIDEFVAQMSYNEMIDLCYGNSKGVYGGNATVGFSDYSVAEKYGVYSADTVDGPAGVDSWIGISTFWPCSTLQACTWNVELIEEIGACVGQEALDSMCDIWLAPGMNIHRSPLCGRNFEYYSEDPVISGKMASATTKGVQSKGVAVAIKHFAVNNKETNRKNSDSRLSEKALREIYLKGFEIAIKESDPIVVMSSYNQINSVFASENAEFLEGILRGEWGWDGLIISDWNSIATNFRVEINSGNNVTMPKADPEILRTAVQLGTLTREKLESNTKYIVSALAEMPDYAINRLKVHDVGTEGTTTVNFTDFSARSFKSYFKRLSSGVMYTSVMNYADTRGSYGYHEFKVNVEKSGYYALSLEYCRSGSALNNAFAVYVNGESVDKINSNLPSTGSVNNIATVDVGYVYLRAGENVIRHQHTSSSDANYIALKLTMSDKSMSVDISSEEATYGDEVTLQVTNNYEGLSSIRGRIESDVALTGFTTENPYEFNPETGEFIIYAMDLEGFARDEVIAELNFTVPEFAAELASGKYEVNIVDIDATDENGAAIDIFAANTGYITVEHTMGDVNLDGIISNADIVTLARYLVHLVEFNEQQLELADVNGDGYITNVDLVMIIRRVIG